MMQDILRRVSAGEDLPMHEMAATVDTIMQGSCDESQIAQLLTALRAKGETVEEVAGAAQAMRRHMTRIRSDRDDLIDTCGTGGDSSGTFNISTAAALVTAAAGVPVAKHGNRAITSKTGSADVLAALGVNVEASVPQIEACLREVGICFCFAPLMHQSMKHVAAVRKKLGVPTIFNMLGPLCNPAEAPYQLLGVGKPRLRPLLAHALELLGIRRGLVVCGEDGLDEVTLSGTTHVTETVASRRSEFLWTPTDFGLPVASKESMQVSGPDESAALILRILEGHPGPPRDIVVLNAAAAIFTTGKEMSPVECARLATEAIDSGAARGLLECLVRVSNDADAR